MRPRPAPLRGFPALRLLSPDPPPPSSSRASTAVSSACDAVSTSPPSRGRDQEVGETEIRTRWPCCPRRRWPRPRPAPAARFGVCTSRGLRTSPLGLQRSVRYGEIWTAWETPKEKNHCTKKLSKASVEGRAGHRPSPWPAGRTRCCSCVPRRGTLGAPGRFAALEGDPVNLSQTSLLGSEPPSGTGVRHPSFQPLPDRSPLRGPRSRAWKTVGPSDGVRHPRTPSSGFSVTGPHVPADRSLLRSSLPCISPS